MTAIGFVGLAAALYMMRTHPKGLYILFFAEMWERFSYYGMRALLIFYLTKHFLFTEDAAYGIYGAYTTLVYILPVIGGYVADRFLGHRRAVMWGAVLLVAGHATMAIEGPPTAVAGETDGTYLNIFYLALALIVMGVGFLKGNISAIVGQLYPRTDTRRDRAFTLFYVGINSGSFFGALYAGYLGETFGWQYGFGLAGIGMLLGLIVFVIGKPLLQGAGELSDEVKASIKGFAGIHPNVWIALGTIILTIGVWWVVRDQDTVGLLLSVFGGLTVAYIIGRSVITLEAHSRDRIFAALFLISVQILFWALFEQAGSSLNIFTDEQVNRNFLGSEVPASVFQSLNAMYIIYFGPVFAAVWGFLASKNLEPTTPQKFGLGVIQVGLGFLVLVWGANAAGDGLTPVIFIFLIYLLHTTGEICLSPVGLSAMTRLSVPSMVGLIMGTWFLASGAGNFVSSKIAQMTAVEGPNGESMVLNVYTNVGWLAVAVGVGLIVISPAINYLMHLKTLTDTGTGLKKDQGKLAEAPVDHMP
ncbi:peptide MFS transporter [Parvularcula sp. LCG005]|uniref:peptide MFS transporter n=1 Tax=Parvularcula sp. LCG005 TaxID=3078805 RepID=UPI003978D2E9